MRCDEIQEHIIEFVYDEGGTPPANSDVWEHIRTCPACRRELEDLRQTRKYLHLWKDEPPLRSAAIAGRAGVLRQSSGWKYLRYAAVAALVVIGFLALANAQMTWNKDGFSFSTHLLPWQNAGRDYYTKAEVRNLMKRALDDSEINMNDTNYIMMQRLLDTIEQDRWMDARLIRGRVPSQNRN